MSSLSYASFVGELRAHVPGFGRIYAEHVRDYDEVLPHVMLGELVRFLTEEVRDSGAESASLRAAMLLLERGMGSPDPKLQELIAVSFLENLDPESESFSVIQRLFGPNLNAQFEKTRM